MDCPWGYFLPSKFTYCEEQLCSLVVNPADTWTNISFFIIAFLIYSSKSDKTLKTLFVVTLVLVGTGSIVFHASMTAWGGVVDMYAMIAISMLILSLSFKKLYSWNSKKTIGFFILGVCLSFTYPLWISTGKPVFGLQVIAAAAIEYYLIKFKQMGLNKRYFKLTLGTFGVGLIFLILDVSKTLCISTNHIFTAHGVWHFLSAFSMYFLFKASTEEMKNIDLFRLTTQSHHLILRPHKISDAKFMLELNSNPEITRYTPDGPLADEALAQKVITGLREQFEEKGIGRFIVELPSSNTQIGWCGLKWLEESQEVDLGFRFLQTHWGKGYATDTSMCCLQYGFEELNFDRITARVVKENMASIAVIEKIGMIKIGVIEEDGLEFEYFQILKENYRNRTVIL